MKTPYEIKKGLECCAYGTCNGCPYAYDGCATNREKIDALEYIQQLENQLADAAKKVEQLEAAQPKWISVEERLPKQYVSVLVYMPDEYPRPTVHEGYLMPDGIWDAAHYLRNPDDVTHWMPLPEPPKE